MIPFRGHDGAVFSLITARNEGLMSDMTTSSRQISMRDITEQWFEDLQAVLAHASFTVPDVRIGVFYTAARLSTGHVGVAFTPREHSDTVCCPRSAAAAPHAGRLAGQDAWALGEYALSP